MASAKRKHDNVTATTMTTTTTTTSGKKARMRQPDAFDLYEERLRRVDALYEAMTADPKTNTRLRSLVAGIRRTSSARFASLLERDRRARELFDAMFRSLEYNDWRARTVQLTILFVSIRHNADLKEYLTRADAPLVDRRAFAHWERRYLVRAVDDFYAAERFDPLSFVIYLTTAYAACLTGDASRHPRAASILSSSSSSQT